jgi:hypothetical protein
MSLHPAESCICEWDPDDRPVIDPACPIHSPLPVRGDRVVIVAGSESDHPRYRDETGTVKQVFASGSVEVELDHVGWSAVFPADSVEVIPT